MRVIPGMLRLLFPPKCLLCGRILDRTETDLCRICRKDTPLAPVLREASPYLDRRTALWYYEDHVRSSLHRFKFGGRRSYAAGYGRMLALKLANEDFPEFDLLTWVPIGRLRLLRRGYDQDRLLARAVGREFSHPPVRLLKKIRNTPPQSRISGAAARRANVLGAFRAVKPDLIRGKRILLLDDIITTGATTDECARVLLTAGAKSVTCAAVARGRHHETTSR